MKCKYYEEKWCNISDMICQYRKDCENCTIVKKDAEIVKLTSIVEGLMDGSYIAINKATKLLEGLK